MLANCCPLIMIVLGLGSLNSSGLTSADQPGTVLLIGGRHQDLTDQHRDLFFELTGGAKAKIVVIPTAVADPELKTPETFLKPPPILQPQSMHVLHTRDRKLADDPAFVKPLSEATGVFFTNGHLHRLTNVYPGTLVEKELKKLLARGGVIAGTGTGAAVLGELVINRPHQEQLTGPGLGLLSKFVILDDDTERGRPKLLQGLAANPDHVGLAIDPGTAVVVSGKSLRVFGEGKVDVRLAKGGGKEAKLEPLKAGAELDVVELRREAASRAGKQQDTKPAPPAAEDADTVRKALAALREAEPTIKVDETRPDKPVVAVHFAPNFGKVTDEELRHLRAFPHLRSLKVPNKQFVTDAGLAHLEGLEELEELTLNGTQATAEGVIRLVKGRTRLTVPHLMKVPLRDDDLPALKDLTELEDLSLRGTLVTDKGVVHLKPFTKLRALNLSTREGLITDAALPHLSHLTELEDLDLDRTAITDAGLAHLKPLTKLRRLQFAFTEVSDAGLERLKDMPNLKEINARGTKVTKEGVERLQQRLPEVKVGYGPATK